jgi:hypothetical protein
MDNRIHGVPHGKRLCAQLLLICLTAASCEDDEGPARPAVLDAADALTDAAVDAPAAPDGRDGSACVPLATVDAQTCPATWAEATAAHKAFCIREWHGGRGLYSADLSTSACRSFLRYTRYLFDAGPRTCLYDPITLDLRGYRAFDGKAMFEATTCDSTPDQYDGKGCGVLTCADVAPDEVACPLPSNLTADAGAGQCHAARLLLRCQLAQGATQICLSSEPSRCSNSAGTSGTDAGAPGGCDQLCASGEYGVSCGGPAPGTTFTPPTGCKQMPPTPGGTFFYCCPCTP